MISNRAKGATVAALIALFTFASGAFALSEGHHAHMGIRNLPIGFIPRANYTFLVELQAHLQQGMTGAAIRVSDYSEPMPSIVNGKTIDGYHPISVTALNAGTVSVQMTVPFAQWSCGRHEVRFTLRLKPNFDGKEQFTTSRAFIWLQGCSTLRNRTNTDWYGGGGGWYTTEGYSIGIQQSPFNLIRAGNLTKWRIQAEADRGCLFRNPDAHGGTVGTAIGSCWSGQSSVTRTLPSNLAVGDRIMLYAEDVDPKRQHAGVYVVWVPAPSDTTVRVDVQDWWETSGLSVP